MARRPVHPTSTQAVADRLALTRRAAGYDNQAPWCRRVGITTAAWNNYERSLRRINIDDAIKVCAATGVTLDWIYRGISAGLPHVLATDIQRLQALPPQRHAS